MRLNPREVRLKQTFENSELGKTQISFWGGETIGDDIWWGGGKRATWEWGQGVGREPDEAGQWGSEG